jgi:hypothetical protein
MGQREPGQLLDRPVIITGAPRCGKTLVQAIVREAPEFFACVEPVMIWNIGLRHHSDDVRKSEEATDRVRARIIRKCAELLSRSGKSRYLDDLSHHCLRLPFVFAVMPNVRVVLVTRNGGDAIPEITWGWTFRQSNVQALRMAVKTRGGAIHLPTLPRLAFRAVRNQLLSRVRGRRASWGATVPGLTESARTCSAAEIAAMQWKGLYETALRDLDALPELPRLQISYEGLLKRTDEEVRRLADFCEVAAPQRLIEFARHFVDPSFVSEQRVNLSDDEWRSIRGRIASTQRRLGYCSEP